MATVGRECLGKGAMGTVCGIQRVVGTMCEPYGASGNCKRVPVRKAAAGTVRQRSRAAVGGGVGGGD